MAEVSLDQVDVGDAETVEIPVVEKIDECELLVPAEKGVTRTEVAVAKLPSVEGDAAQVISVVLLRRPVRADGELSA